MESSYSWRAEGKHARFLSGNDSNDFKRTSNVTSSGMIAIKCSTPNLPSCGLSDLQMSDDFKFLFPSFYCYSLRKKEHIKTG